MSMELWEKKKLNSCLSEEESKDRSETITVEGKFLSGDDDREIGYVLVPCSFLHMHVQA